MIEVIAEITESHLMRVSALGALGRRFESCRPDWVLSDWQYCMCAKCVRIYSLSDYGIPLLIPFAHVFFEYG